VIDWNRPIWIVAVPQGDRMAIMGGSNIESDARQLHLLAPSARLLVATLAPEAEPLPIAELTEDES
jgi:hypothetical protein